MDNHNCTSEHRKNQHLTLENRMLIQLRLKDGYTIYKIAKEIGCVYNTVKNEIKRGTVVLYNGSIKRYKASVGQATYNEHRKNSRKQYKRLKCAKFIRYVEKQFYKQDWSYDASVGNAKLNHMFDPDKVVCTKTLYNYTDIGLMKIKNIDLPEKTKRKTKSSRTRQNKKILGKSIEERPKSVDNRNEFGHWEIDSVLGSKTGDDSVILTIVERMTRNVIWLKLKDHSDEAVTEAVVKLKIEYGDKFSEVFKSITGDNGSEFAGLSAQESDGMKVYFTHPYSSWEKGTNERHNGLLRRFVPKGYRIDRFSAEDISFIADWSNGLPRKILGYHTPEELFETELDRIYAA